MKKLNSALLFFAGMLAIVAGAAPVAIAQCDTYFKRISSNLFPINGRFIRADDVTGDGVPDLIGIYQDPFQTNNRSKVIIIPANGTGGFGAPQTFDAPVGWQIADVIVGKFDNDGLKDLLVRLDNPTQNYRIYRNTGGGNFQMSGNSAGFLTNNLAFDLVDINNDGRGDIMTSGGFISYSLGNGDGTFQDPVPFSSGFNPRTADINADGLMDFTIGGNLLINQGGGTFATVSNGLGVVSEFIHQEVRDMTGDGLPDFVGIQFAAPGTIVFFKNVGSNAFSRTEYPLPASNTTNSAKIYLGNFAGSSAPDILLQSRAMNRAFVLVNDGAGNFSLRSYDYGFSDFYSGQTFAGDFDSDGKSDIVAAVDGTRPNLTRRRLFSVMNAFVLRNVCTPAGQTRIVDFDASGSSDFSYFSPAAGTWNWLPSSNVSVSPISIPWGAGSFGDIPAPGDFDSDGKTDVTVYRDPTGEWWSRRSSDGGHFAVRFGLPGDKPVVGDYDGDAISDIAVWRPSEGNWYILFTGSQQWTAAHWGLDGDVPVPEDYDGDGKTDLAVYRPSTGTWYIFRTSDFGLSVARFGLASDRAIPADYDGDGKADVAVFRNSNSTLYISPSFSGGAQILVTGDPQMTPIPGDVDGDFIAEPFGYVPASRQWYTLALGGTINFGSTDAVPTSSILRVQ